MGSLGLPWLSSVETPVNAGSIPGQGTKIPHAVWCSQKIKGGEDIYIYIYTHIHTYEKSENGDWHMK